MRKLFLSLSRLSNELSVFKLMKRNDSSFDNLGRTTSILSDPDLKAG